MSGMSDSKKIKQERLLNVDKKNVSRRRNRKKKQQLSRWSGLILLLLIMIIGFVLWASGETMEGESRKNTGKIDRPRESVLKQSSQGVIIIE